MNAACHPSLITYVIASPRSYIYIFQVPKGLAYFAVEFGLDGGFAHVIEDDDRFPHYFGKVSASLEAKQ